MNRFPIFLLTFTILLSGCFTQENRASGDGPLLEVPTITMPRYDGFITEAEWAGARVIKGNFTIADGGKADGAYPFTLRVGVTKEALVFAVEVENKTANPYSGNGTVFADHLIVFFSTSGEPELVPPSFVIGSATYPGSTFTDRGFWNGVEWEINPRGSKLTLDDHGQPSGGTWTMAQAGNGTTSFEVYTPRHATHSKNSLQLSRGASFSVCLSYMRGGDIEDKSPDARGDFRWPHDTFPGEGYTPNGMYEVKDWLNFRVP